jgi:hypothetical protein
MTAIEICEEPVFVLGAPRSGTSMMQWALRQHPALWGGPESDFLIPLFDDLREVFEYGSRRDELHWLSGQGVSWEEFLAHLGHGVNSLYTNRAGGLRWVEQTPSYVNHLDDLLAMFPGARFVFMLRDGRSVVESLRRFVEPMELAEGARVWQVSTAAGLAFGESADGDRLHVARYEAAVTDTEGELKRLFEFLGLPHEPESVDFIRAKSPINASFPGESSADKVAPRWLEWLPADRELFDQIAGDTLIAAGYEPDHSWVTAG